MPRSGADGTEASMFADFATHMSADCSYKYVPGFLSQLPDQGCKYHYDAYLARGASGTTWRVLRCGDRQPFALKIANLEHLSPEARQRTCVEVQCLQTLQHFACVKLIDQHRTENWLYLILEYCDAADLHYQLRRLDTPVTPPHDPPIGMEEYCLKFVLLQLVLGLHHMHHGCHILHRDLKPANVLLTTNGLVKIGDFGLSCQYDARSEVAMGRRICGTPPYLAPEIWHGRGYSPAADVWSLGVLLYECMARHVPFTDTDPQALQHSILTQEPDWRMSEAYSAPLRELVRQLLQKAPSARPTATMLLLHPYVQAALAQLPAVLAASAVAPVHRASIFADIHAQLATVPACVLRPMLTAPGYVTDGDQHVVMEHDDTLVAPLLLRRSSKHASPTHSYTTMSACSMLLTNSIVLPAAESHTFQSVRELHVARAVTVLDASNTQPGVLGRGVAAYHVTPSWHRQPGTARSNHAAWVAKPCT